MHCYWYAFVVIWHNFWDIIFNFRYFSSGHFIMWARMWGSVSVFRNQKGSVSENIWGNTVIECSGNLTNFCISVFGVNPWICETRKYEPEKRDGWRYWAVFVSENVALLSDTRFSPEHLGLHSQACSGHKTFTSTCSLSSGAALVKGTHCDNSSRQIRGWLPLLCRSERC
jgi:hypothetical protein